MKYYVTIVVLLSLSFSSCVREKSTVYKAIMQNNSGKTIKMIPYKLGILQESNVLILSSKDSVIVANGFDRGIVNQAGFNHKYFSNVDSVHVVFDDTFIVTHYVKAPQVFSNKYLLYGDSRNILNYLSFEYTFSDNSKSSRIANYKYTFTEHDYNFAKEP